jgi:actin cytoskeleton-regulatory complex protein SLA1
MLCFHVQTYGGGRVQAVELQDLTSAKNAFKVRTADNKFLSDDLLQLTLSTKKPSARSSSIATSNVASPSASASPVSAVSSSDSQPVTANSSSGPRIGRSSVIPGVSTTTPVAKKSLPASMIATDASHAQTSGIETPSASSPALPPPPPPPPRPSKKTAIMMYDYAPEGPGIAVVRGEVVVLVETSDPNWWLVKNSNEQDGWVPASYLQIN